MTTARTRGRPKSVGETADQNTIQSLDRAMVILIELSQAGDLTLSELATRLDQSPATVYRVLMTLAARQIVELDPSPQKWHVGPGAFRIGSAFLRRTNLVERARPFLRELVLKTGETANLGVQNGGRVLFVSQVETHAAIRAFFPPGTVSPMHASGIGKALLAQLHDGEIEHILEAEGQPQFTENTIATVDQLMAELARVRAKGFAVDNEERHVGMRCVASPIFNATGYAVAGISISGPTSRIGPRDIPRLSEDVRSVARQLSIALGASDETIDSASQARVTA